MVPVDYAITTDYVVSEGCPEPYLKRIAEAGWRWVHWCHHWHDDFLYDEPELDQIARWLGEMGLRVLDIHGSEGREKHWASPREHERLAGVNLVRNRIELAGRVGCGVVIMHPPPPPPDTADGKGVRSLFCSPEASSPSATKKASDPFSRPSDPFRRTLAALEPDCRRRGVRLAFENLAEDNFAVIQRLLDEYDPGFVGLCYDSGHGLISGTGLDRLDEFKSRLIALHLHDNDGRGDLHQPLFMGRVDWPRLAQLIAASPYDRPAVTIEAVIKHSGFTDEPAFLRETLRGAAAFGQQVADLRRPS